MKRFNVARFCCLAVVQVVGLSIVVATGSLVSAAVPPPPGGRPGTPPPPPPGGNRPPANPPPTNPPPTNPPPTNPPPGNPPPGVTPLQGLTADQLADFREGVEDFTERESLSTGLGPVFNARSCA